MPSGRYDALRAAIDNREKAIKPFRQRRTDLIRDYVGSDYSDYGSPKRVYVDIMHQTADTYTQVLSASRPRVLITTRYPNLRWFAKHFQRALNNHIQEIRLEEELRACVLDAFFCIGVMKIYYGADTPQKLEGTDIWVDPGRPYAEHLSLDNFGFDTKATSWRKIQFAWDDYYVSKEELLKDQAFADKAELIERASRHKINESVERASSITYPLSGEDAEEFDPQLRLRDVWLPRQNKVITLFADSEFDSLTGMTEVLREVDWEGPEGGPYRVLTLSDTPDNIIGVSPGMLLRNLSDLINSLYRKQVNQAQKQRDIPIYEAGHEDDAQRLQRAEDGRWTKVKSKEAVDVLKMGGVDPSNAQFALSVIEMYDRMAGNLPAMAGLGPSAGTLGQEELVQSNVSKRQAKMQTRVVEFTTDVLRDIGWLLWNDQNREIATEYQIPGTDLTTTSIWNPEHREGKFILYNFDIEPFSMAYQPPAQKANALLTYVSQIAVPMLQMIMQSGGNIDFKELTQTYAELVDLPQLNDVVTFQPDQRDQLQPGAEPPPRPGATTRTHVRRNVSTGGTTSSQNIQGQQAFAQLAAQAGPQMTGMMNG